MRTKEQRFSEFECQLRRRLGAGQSLGSRLTIQELVLIQLAFDAGWRARDLNRRRKKH